MHVARPSCPRPIEMNEPHIFQEPTKMLEILETENRDLAKMKRHVSL